MTTGTFTGGSPLTFTIPGITNPTAAQAASTTVAAATTDNAGVIIDTSTTGTFVAITGTLGVARPAVVISNANRGATGVIMTVSLTPETLIPTTGKIIITLSGAGLAVAAPGTLTFTTGGAVVGYVYSQIQSANKKAEAAGNAVKADTPGVFTPITPEQKAANEEAPLEVINFDDAEDCESCKL
jgi:hypothetical protein